MKTNKRMAVCNVTWRADAFEPGDYISIFQKYLALFLRKAYFIRMMENKGDELRYY